MSSLGILSWNKLDFFFYLKIFYYFIQIESMVTYFICLRTTTFFWKPWTFTVAYYIKFKCVQCVWWAVCPRIKIFIKKLVKMKIFRNKYFWWRKLILNWAKIELEESIEIRKKMIPNMNYMQFNVLKMIFPLKFHLLKKTTHQKL